MPSTDELVTKRRLRKDRRSARILNRQKAAKIEKEKQRRIASKQPYQLNDRNEFPQLLNDLKLSGPGVEVGVFHGTFSETWMRCDCHPIYLVDRWQYVPSELFDESWLLSKDFKAARNRFNDIYQEVYQKFENDKRVVVLRLDSIAAANVFPDNYFDFIYIDADHSYEAVTQDLHAWYPKMRSRGVFAGHDYEDRKYSANRWGHFSHCGVQPAVTAFFKQQGNKFNPNQFFVIPRKRRNPPSWYYVCP